MNKEGVRLRGIYHRKTGTPGREKVPQQEPTFLLLQGSGISSLVQSPWPHPLSPGTRFLARTPLFCLPMADSLGWLVLPLFHGEWKWDSVLFPHQGPQALVATSQSPMASLLCVLTLGFHAGQALPQGLAYFSWTSRSLVRRGQGHGRKVASQTPPVL